MSYIHISFQYYIRSLYSSLRTTSSPLTALFRVVRHTISMGHDDFCNPGSPNPLEWDQRRFLHFNTSSS